MPMIKRIESNADENYEESYGARLVRITRRQTGERLEQRDKELAIRDGKLRIEISIPNPSRIFILHPSSFHSPHPVRDRHQQNKRHPQQQRPPHQSHRALQKIGVGVIAQAEFRAVAECAVLMQHISELYPERAAAACEDDPLIGLKPAARLLAPAVNGVFEVADDRKTDRGQAHRYPVERFERQARELSEFRVAPRRVPLLVKQPRRALK
jgi:hypothetical protein